MTDSRHPALTYLARLQAKAAAYARANKGKSPGFHYNLDMWVDDRSAAAKALRAYSEEHPVADRDAIRAAIEDLVTWVDRPGALAAGLQDLADLLGITWDPPRDFAEEVRERTKEHLHD